MEKEINHRENIPHLLEAMLSVHNLLQKESLDQKLVHLVLLRVSQINRCHFCVDMHVRDARKAGESNERLDMLTVWEHSDLFTDAEKAAFAWAEHLTLLDPDRELGPDRKRLRAWYSEREISALTVVVSMINFWNRLNISNHRTTVLHELQPARIL